MKQIISLVVIILLSNCARIGTPTGGDKDTSPPVLIKSIPANETLNFNGDKIVLIFDEFVVLKDIQKNLLISPPLKKMPKISPLGVASKTISIEFDQKLQANTTYLINLGQSIADYNENNKLNGLQLVFSTGNTIDSLKLSGKVIPVHFDKKPENIILGLYPLEQFKDSMVYKEKPFYITTAQKNNNFNFSYLKKGKYKLVAIADENHNYLYNPAKDAIGFLSDTIVIPADTLVNIKLFKEIIPTKIDEIKQLSSNNIQIKLEGDGHNVTILPQQKNIEYIQKNTSKKIDIWYKTDSDSLKFEFKTEKQLKKFYRKRTEKTDSLQVQITTKNRINPKDTVSITSNIPIMLYDKEKIQLFKNDSIAIQPELIKTVNYTLNVSFQKDYDTSYKLIVLPKAITDFLGNQNKDTIQAVFKIPAQKTYGNLFIELENPKGKSVFIELLNDKNTIIRQTPTQNTSKFSFKDLLPGKYKIRIVFDDNKNNKWDTGDYSQHQKPEKTKKIDKIIEIRANWDINQKIAL